MRSNSSERQPPKNPSHRAAAFEDEDDDEYENEASLATNAAKNFRFLFLAEMPGKL
jgi:hypothetical protein